MVYLSSMALLTDLYELTMAAAYWKEKMEDDEAVFHLFFRTKPFEGGYCVAAGLEPIIDYLQKWQFDRSDLDYLLGLRTEENKPLFEKPFLDYLSKMKFSCDIDAVAEGEVVFPFEPLLRVRGPLIQAQLLESVLLTLTNFSSLIATKASRVRYAAGDDEIIEFGLRRAQGVDGALTASRAAYIGGCSSTSNTLAGKLYNIPVRGTHAHSWIMAFDDERAAFSAYARAMPHQSIFLVDTYDSLEGVKHAIEIGKWLKARGDTLQGIRLDSGDINYLSQKARKALDEAGFTETKIVASNELNELLISDLKRQGAKVDVWGVGTSLVTGQSQPALDGVYKLSAIRKKGSKNWKPRIKFSEHMTKVSDPGILQVRRYLDENLGYIADAIYHEGTDLQKAIQIIDPLSPLRRRNLSSSLRSHELLKPIFKEGELVYTRPTLLQIRSYARQQLSLFDESIRRFFNPHVYPVGMEKSLYDMKVDLIEKLRVK